MNLGSRYILESVSLHALWEKGTLLKLYLTVTNDHRTVTNANNALKYVLSRRFIGKLICR